MLYADEFVGPDLAMRGLTTVTLALLGLAAAIPEPQRRKSLSFGPVLPHARFDTSAQHPVPASFSPLRVPVDPLEVARSFLDTHVDSDNGVTYVIRGDSYTDKATGVTHVYARQLIQGVHVADAHINLNIKDGVILSVGDSVRNIFYSRPPALTLLIVLSRPDSDVSHPWCTPACRILCSP